MSSNASSGQRSRRGSTAGSKHSDRRRSHGLDSERSPAGDLLLGVDGIELTSTALFVTDEALPFETWASVVARLVPLETGASWWVGDAIAFGEKKYGHTYAAAVEATGRSLQTLKNLAWVSRSVPPNRRDRGLSWRVHREVAPLRSSDQREWLRCAKAASWSAEELRRRLRAPNRPTDFPEVEVEDAPARHEYRCPHCRHEWSGDPRPEEEET